MTLFLDHPEISKKGIAKYYKGHSNTALKAIMVVEISNYLNRVEATQYTIFTQKFHNSITKTIRQFTGDVIKNDNSTYLVFFGSVIDAVLCGLQIQYKFKYVTPKHQAFKRQLNIALSGGAQLASGKAALQDAITLATRMCEMVQDPFVISSEIKTQYEGENHNAVIDREQIRTLTMDEENFLTQVLDYTELNWNKPSFNVDTFSKGLGCSKSQLYRRLKRLTGTSPNRFIRAFRLNKALLLLHQQQGSIAQIADETGFSSATYFSKCFLKKYGILPSRYIQQHIY